MPFKFNPFSGNFDQTGSGGGGGGGGGASYIDGEVQNFSALPQTIGSPAVDSAYLVREAEGTWLLGRKPAGIYIRTANTGTRASDWTYAGEFPDVFNDANFVLYDSADSTKNLQFQLSSIATGTTRTITIPNKNVTLDDAGDSRTPSSHAASHAAGIKASYNGQVLGMSTNVLIRAVNAGTAGNSITLAFDGVDDIDTVLAAWNAANTSNTAGLVLGDGSQVPDNGEEIALSGGVAGGSDPFKNINQDLGTTDSPNFAGATINQNGAWGLTVNSGNSQTNTADFTGDSTNYNLIRVQNTDGGSSFYMACTGSGYTGSNFGESNAGQVSLEVNGGGTNKVGLIGNRHGPLCLGADDQIQLRLDSNGTTISDPTTVTKKVRFSASSVTAGQTRVVTFPDKNITLDDTGDTRPPASHTHGNLTNDGKVGSTAGLPLVTTTAGAVTTLALGAAGTVLTVNSGATGVEFAAASGGGVTGAASSASDVLGVSGANITGVDAGSDKIVFWDDSASELTYLTVGSGLSLTNTELTATATGGGTKTYAVFAAVGGGNQPPATNFAVLDTRNSIAVLRFRDTTADDAAIFVGVMPEAAVLSSGLQVRLHWMSDVTSGNVRWQAHFQRCDTGTDLDTDSFDTNASNEATGAASATSGQPTITTITCGSGAIDGIVAGDAYRLRITREQSDTTNDTMGGFAQLIAVEVRSAA